jgi:hypothetical protein
LCSSRYKKFTEEKVFKKDEVIVNIEINKIT